MSVSSVPIVDFSDGSSRKTGRALVAACQSHGFAILTNTGITQEDIDAQIAQSKRFFDAPLEVKQKVAHPADPANHVGWSGVGSENGSQEFDREKLDELRKKGADFKESLEVWPPEHPILHNLLPDDKDLPGFSAATLDFFEQAYTLARRVVSTIALGLPGDLPADHFDPYMQQRTVQLRLLHYPPNARKEFDSERIRQMNAHTVRSGLASLTRKAFCLCTLLFQDDVGGLQIEDPNKPGSFIDVPCIPGGVVFNVADCLARWTNDELSSPQCIASSRLSQARR